MGYDLKLKPPKTFYEDNLSAGEFNAYWTKPMDETPCGSSVPAQLFENTTPEERNQGRSRNPVMGPVSQTEFDQILEIGTEAQSRQRRPMRHELMEMQSKQILRNVYSRTSAPTMGVRLDDHEVEAFHQRDGLGLNRDGRPVIDTIGENKRREPLAHARDSHRTSFEDMGIDDNETRDMFSVHCGTTLHNNSPFL